MTKLDRASNLELLIELMYSGKSGIVESLASEEPIDPEKIVELLSTRTGRPRNAEFRHWYNWFTNENSGESESDIEILQELLEFKDSFDTIVKRIRDSR